MLRRLAILALLALSLTITPAQAADPCQFTLGFKSLADAIPDVVGQCTDNVAYNPANGDALQHTTTGLFVWRKADNVTAFTNGYWTWMNGPYGLQDRINTEKFDWEGQPQQGQQQPPTPPAVQTPTPVPPVPQAPPAVALQGKAASATAAFDLAPGIALFEAKHDGKRNFAVWLVASDGSKKDLLVNNIGTYSGQVLRTVGGDFISARAGKYILNVEADGNWSVRITQPVYTGGPSLPVSLSGKGAAATTPFVLAPGLPNFSFRHDGKRNFAVWLVAADGSRKDLLVNQIGNYQGNQSVPINETSYSDAKPGVYVLSVEADGSWNAEIK